MKSSQLGESLLFFSLGWGAQYLQLTLLQKLWISFFGNEAVLTLAVSLWLIGGALGAYFGVLTLSHRKVTCFAFASLVLFSLLSPLWILFSPLVFSPLPGSLLDFNSLLLVAFTTIGLCSFLLALLYSHLLSQLSIPPAKGYGLEGLGALVSGLAFSFWFIFHPSWLGLGIAFALATASLTLWLFHSFLKAILLFSLFLLLSFLSPSLETLLEEKRWEQYLGKDYQFLDSQATPYGQITRLKKGEKIYFFHYASPLLALPAETQTSLFWHFLLNQHPKPQNLLFLGIPPAGVSETLIYPLKQVDCVIWNPFLWEKIQPYLSEKDLQALKNWRFYWQDPLLFFEEEESFLLYDWIYLSAPPPSTFSSNRFYTREFFEKIRQSLSPTGVFLLPLPSAMSLHSKSGLTQMGKLLYRTLSLSFRYIQILPGDRALFLCSNSPQSASLNPRELARRLAKYPTPPSFQKQISSSLSREEFYTALFENWIPVEHLESIFKTYRGDPPSKGKLPWMEREPLWERLKKLSHAPPSSPPWNQVSTPFAVYFYLKNWWEKMDKPKLLYIFLFLACLLGAKIIFSGTLSTFLMFTIGWLGMVFELALLFHFQNHWGNLYLYLGVFFGLFMFSLYLGTLWKKRKFLPLSILSLSLIGFLFFFSSSKFPLYIYALAISWLGFCTGFGYASLAKEKAEQGGILYSADLLGAAVGALTFPFLLWLGFFKLFLLVAITFLALLLSFFAS